MDAHQAISWSTSNSAPSEALRRREPLPREASWSLRPPVRTASGRTCTQGGLKGPIPRQG